MKFAVGLALFAALPLAFPIQKRGRLQYDDFTTMSEQEVLASVDVETGVLVPRFMEIRQGLIDLQLNPRQFLCGTPGAYKSEDGVESTEALRMENAQKELEAAENDDESEGEEVDADKRLVSVSGKRKERLLKVIEQLRMYEQESRRSFMDVGSFYCRSENWARD